MQYPFKNTIKGDESENTEFKTSFQAEVIETLVAFANAKGGKVFVGVSDNGKIQGVSLTSETVAQWVNQIKNKTSPSLVPDVETIETEGKTFVVLEQKEYPVKPVAFRGKNYKRVGNANHLMSTSEVADMHLRTFNSSWDNYFTNYYSLDAISLGKEAHFIEMANQIRENKITDSPLEVLRKFELLREDKISNACYLLFAKTEVFAATINIGRFADAITIKDSLTLREDLINQVEIIIGYIQKHLNKEYIITGNPQREERWQYPLPALREIVVNMIVHRDYQHSGESIIKIFDGSIEFFNPGKLPDDISIEQLLSGQYTSQARNKKIAAVFRESGMIEQYGSGIRRIINAFVAYGLDVPIFENFQHGFRVLVKNNIAEKDLENYQLSEYQKKIIDAIKKNNYITQRELSIEIGINARNIRNHINHLKEKGLLKRIGPDKGGYWKIINPNKETK